MTVSFGYHMNVSLDFIWIYDIDFHFFHGLLFMHICRDVEHLCMVFFYVVILLLFWYGITIVRLYYFLKCVYGF